MALLAHVADKAVALYEIEARVNKDRCGEKIIGWFSPADGDDRFVKNHLGARLSLPPHAFRCARLPTRMVVLTSDGAHLRWCDLAEGEHAVIFNGDGVSWQLWEISMPGQLQDLDRDLPDRSTSTRNGLDWEVRKPPIVLGI